MKYFPCRLASYPAGDVSYIYAENPFDAAEKFMVSITRKKAMPEEKVFVLDDGAFWISFHVEVTFKATIKAFA